MHGSNSRLKTRGMVATKVVGKMGGNRGSWPPKIAGIGKEGVRWQEVIVRRNGKER